MHKEIYEKYHAIKDKKWMDIICRTPDEQIIDGVAFPGFPSREIQVRMIGSSGTQSLQEVGQLYREIKRYMKKRGKRFSPDTKVLDYGCGYGRLMRFFMKDVTPGNLHGTDVDENFIGMCNDCFNGDLSFSVNKSAPPTQYPDSFFDIIYAYSVFTHLSEPFHFQWLNELRRIAKPDALIFITLRQLGFLKQCHALRQQENLSGYSKIIGDAFGDLETIQSLYNQGQFIYNPSGGGGVRTSDFYGDTVIPPNYIINNWSMFRVVDMFDDFSRMAQALVVLAPNNGMSDPQGGFFPALWSRLMGKS